MQTQATINYERIGEAINFIKTRFKEQPGLNEIAEAVHLSPAHFQRLFTDWAGVSPKKFLQYISLQHAKKMLTEEQATLVDTAFETGLSSTSRLHDLFINIEGMTPAEYKNGGSSLAIDYSFQETPFGAVIVATTNKGICYMAFEEDASDAVSNLKERFPNAQFQNKANELQKRAVAIFQQESVNLKTIKLHLKGSEFQLKVWESLLKIPMGKLSTYGTIATQIGNSKASRAVGTAIGSNPVAFLIPCHRVIQSSGNIGGYMWGPTRKTAIIGWESAMAYGN